MFEFANRPPQGPEDITLALSGNFLLTDAIGFLPGSKEHNLGVIGQAACSELIGALDSDEDTDTERFSALRDQVTEVVGWQLTPEELAFFSNGFAVMEKHNLTGEGVAA